MGAVNLIEVIHLQSLPTAAHHHVPLMSRYLLEFYLLMWEGPSAGEMTLSLPVISCLLLINYQTFLNIDDITCT